MRLGRRLFALALLPLLAVASPVPVAAQAGGLTVFAAASMKDSLDEVVKLWQQESGKRVVVSYAASSALARQIEQGAPADLFISADLDWMDYLTQRALIKAETRSNLLGNRIALVAGRSSTVTAKIAPGFDLSGLVGGGKVAMADTVAVPAGKYGKASLEALNVWPSVQGKVAQAENVRAALLLVSRGEAPLGIVYTTDATADPGVRIVDTFPENSHPPILYPVAMTAASRHGDAAAFLAYLASPKARAVFAKAGFSDPR